MKSKFNEDDFKRLKFEIHENKDITPEPILSLLQKSIDLLAPHFKYELPLSRDLTPVIENLIYAQNANIAILTKDWGSKWVKEISELVSTELASDITDLFINFENGVNLTALYKDFDKMVEFYVRPHHAKRSSISEFDNIRIPQEVKEQIIQESYDEQESECMEYNTLKTGFLEAVQPLIFKYFEDRMNDLSIESWNHYGITLGFAFHEFNDNCIDLEYYLSHDENIRDSGLGFYDYDHKHKQEFNDSLKDKGLTIE